MVEKYQNKYRIPSARMKNYDYVSNAAYFVTIVTKNRVHFFGMVVNTPKLGISTMQLSPIGEIAQKYWNEIPQHFPFIRLDEMIIMPNHIHGILVIDRDLSPNVETPNVETPNVETPNVETPKLGVSTRQLPRNKNHNPEWKPGTIGVILNQFKRICTIKSRNILPNFAWQTRFHDRIIRNENELNRIRKYIIENPIKWEQDRNNRDNLWF